MEAQAHWTQPVLCYHCVFFSLYHLVTRSHPPPALIHPLPSHFLPCCCCFIFFPLHASVLQREAKRWNEATQRWLERMFGPFVSPSQKRLCHLNNGQTQIASAVTAIACYWQWKRRLNLWRIHFSEVLLVAFCVITNENELLSLDTNQSIRRQLWMKYNSDRCAHFPAWLQGS